jgi:hypothetical protein
MDHVTVRHAADDLHNFHGIWGRIQSVSGNEIILEKNASLRPTLHNSRPGDRLRFIHRKTGALLGEAKVTAVRDFQVSLDQAAAPFEEAQVEWLDHECAGWVVQNCRLEDNFQRLLIMSGPGTVRGCTFARMGSNISLNTGMGLVGGIPSDITIADNFFIDVCPRPKGSSIEARAHNAEGKEGVPPIERLFITGNTFVRSGGPALHLAGIRDATIANNRFEAPVRASVIAAPDSQMDCQAVMLRHSSGVLLRANDLSDAAFTRPDPISRSPMLGIQGVERIAFEGRILHEGSGQKKDSRGR